MRYLLLLMFFLLGFINPLYSKGEKGKANTISIGIGDYKVFGVLGDFSVPLPIPQIAYMRKIDEHWGVGGRYSFWRTGTNYVSIQSEMRFKPEFNMYGNVGDLDASNNFKYFDVEAFYLKDIKGMHSLMFSLGASYATFRNVYVESITRYLQPNGQVHLASLTTYGKNKQAYGLVGGIEYSYKFWKERINVGVDLKGRFYPSEVPFHIVYGLHTGFNF